MNPALKKTVPKINLLYNFITYRPPNKIYVAAKDFFRKHGICPSKGLGQNFLINRTVLGRIVEVANLNPKSSVLEIGPGIGNLTFLLAKEAKKVIAIEKDSRMAGALNYLLKKRGIKNVRVISRDVLEIKGSSISKWLDGNYKLIANLPYYIVSPVIRKFLEMERPPEEMVLMIQKEVAQRICARPPKMNLLSVSVRLYAEPKIIFFVSRKSFWPQPKVDGAIIKITPKKLSTRSVLVDRFFKIVRAGFSQPRKQILNNLSKGLKLDKKRVDLWLSQNGISTSRRAETLSIDEWTRLVKNFIILGFQSRNK